MGRLAFVARAAFVAFAACAAAACADRGTELEFADELNVDPAAMDQRPSGLWVRDIEEGTGPVAAPGQRVVVHYTGWLPDGLQFDSSRDRGQPYGVVIGQGSVIEGWDQGIPGMRVGGRRQLVIPPHLAYGAGGSGPIPPNATLVFDVELLDVGDVPTLPPPDDSIAESE